MSMTYPHVGSDRYQHRLVEQHDKRLRHHVFNSPPKHDISSLDRSEIASVASLLAHAPCSAGEYDGPVGFGDEKGYTDKADAGLDVKDILKWGY